MEIKISQDSIKKLQSIQDFPDLVKYLADELDWPIETEDFDEMTFEYSAEELGLDKKISPKFLDIRRLRPLDNDQPWGIFFIAFDETRLPVVALRRLLSKLALTKRSTSNASERASWHANDLLLISQTGNNDGRSISFAHFTSNPKKKDLPILKVLGWDSDDTGLKIDHVIKTLREKLIWPEDPSDSDAWREQWRNAFTLKNREVIQSSKEMAQRLGQLALAVRNRLREVLAIEAEEGPLNKLMLTFKENLISNLDAESFSDMYAQTIAYGLLSARIINPKANTADAAHTEIPITNPFLKDSMETFLNIGGRKNNSNLSLDFDELGINEVIDLLDKANMEAVLRDFGDRNQKEDPVMHFFEEFLEEYDSSIKKKCGVFYTPQPVVSFIVNIVDKKLKTEFGLEDGLADITSWDELAERIPNLEIPKGTPPKKPFVQILDPATGTGTFLVESIDLIHKTMVTKWKSSGHSEMRIKELWNKYVSKYLLPRLHGYELMMAPYAIAHLKIGLKLHETGYLFESDERVRVYLNNALESPQDFSGTMAFAIPALADEAKACNIIKENKKFTVILGNPPYSKISSNLDPEMRAGINKYRFLNGIKIKEKGALQFEINLQDDYVKFFRFFESKIEETGAGIIGLITNNGYLTTPTLRGMRKALMETFSSINILDLHGHIAKGEIGPSGKKEENIFDIVQGVAVFIGSKVTLDLNEFKEIKTADSYGTRSEKLNFISSISKSDQLRIFKKILPTDPYYIFAYRDIKHELEWEKFISLTDLFIKNSAGVITGRDGLVVADSSIKLSKKIEEFSKTKATNDDIYAHFGFTESKRFDIQNAQLELQKLDSFKTPVRQMLYRPFDEKFIFYDKSLVHSMSRPISDSMLEKDNLALLATRQVTRPQFEHVFVSKSTIEIKACSHDRNTQMFPLFIKSKSEDNSLFNEKIANFDHKTIKNISETMKMKFNDLESSIDSKNNFTPTSLFRYIYSILHSPEYRERYYDFLRSDFPKIPITHKQDLFLKLANIGDKLINLHTLNVDEIPISIPKFIGSNRKIDNIGWTKDNGGTLWLDGKGTSKNYEKGINGFNPVPKEVWEFQIGGYQVCKKWLKDRSPNKNKQGRNLDQKELEHFQNTIGAINHTIKIMPEIDKTIERYGGWPDAFKS